MNQTSPNADGAQSVLTEAVLLLIVGVLAYYIGWAYLYFYLGYFGIQLSEIELSVEAVLIYAAPPLFWAWQEHWLAAVSAVLLVAVGYAVLRFSGKARRIRELVKGLLDEQPALLRLLSVFLIAGAFVLSLSPFVKASAYARASQRWDQTGVKTQVLLRSSERSRHGDDFQACLERRALELIFADRERYFLLCISELNAAYGALYEVRRSDPGIASVRMLERTHP